MAARALTARLLSKYYLLFSNVTLLSPGSDFHLEANIKGIQEHNPNGQVINVTAHAQDIRMLTVLEPCDCEYRVRALLRWPRRGVTSLLIGDIRVPAAASYPRFQIAPLFLVNLFTFSSPPSSCVSPSLLIAGLCSH